jgi:putative peptidoglycan lipid II flippase
MLLFWMLRKRGIYSLRPGWPGFLARLALALGVLAAVLYLLAGQADYWLHASLWTKVGRLAGVVAAGAAAYLGTLFLLGFRLRDFNRREHI